MGRLVFSLAVFLCGGPPLLAQTHESYGIGKRYIVTISEEALRKSPAWDADAENPPLSARKALKLADEKKAKLVQDSKSRKWELQAIALMPGGDDKWYWLVHYEARPRVGGTGINPFLRLAVLMNGTVIDPKVQDYPPRKE